MDLLKLFISSIFVNNIALTFFLGMCSLIALSKDIKTSWGMGLSVSFVTTLTAMLNWIIYHYLLVPFHLEFMAFIIFIVTIAATVQALEMFIDRFSPALYVTMGVFLPLITVNCIILAVSIFMNIRNYSFAQTLVYALGSGLGWLVAIMALAGINQKLRFSDIPTGLQGPGIAFIILGFVALGFMGFAGLLQ